MRDLSLICNDREPDRKSQCEDLAIQAMEGMPQWLVERQKAVKGAGAAAVISKSGESSCGEQ